jgi:hypothetical protein
MLAALLQQLLLLWLLLQLHHHQRTQLPTKAACGLRCCCQPHASW